MSHYSRYYLDNNSTKHGLSREHLRAVGPTIPIVITVPDVLIAVLGEQGKIIIPVDGLALIDTGASSTMVDETVLKSLGVNAVSVRDVGTPNGASPMNIYPAKLTFPGTDLPALNFNGVLSSPYLKAQQNIIALIGRDILQHGSFTYNGDGHISISLRNKF